MRQYLKRERDREQYGHVDGFYAKPFAPQQDDHERYLQTCFSFSLSLSLNESVFCVFFVSHFVVGLLWSLCIFKRGREQTRFLPKLCFRFCP